MGEEGTGVNSTRPRRVVFTAMMGRYEQLNEQPIAKTTDVEFICFTDDPELTSESWTIRVVSPRFPMDSIRSARYLKTLGPTLLPEYDETLWIDNSVRLMASPDSLMDSWLSEADIAIPRHSFRASVMGEFDAVATDGYDDPARVYEQLIHYSTLRPEALSETPLWTALLARRRTPAVDAAMRLWLDHILRYSRRDQLSINFIAGSLGLHVTALEIDNMTSEWHEWPVRVAKRWDLTQDRMGSALRVPSAEIGRLENSLAQLRAEYDTLAREHAKLVEQSPDATDRALRNLAKHYESSTSWRLTAPFRALAKRGRQAKP
jgi:hypothetical protein